MGIIFEIICVCVCYNSHIGAMLSATDPVAVVALLKELGVSERLSILIEGERGCLCLCIVANF